MTNDGNACGVSYVFQGLPFDNAFSVVNSGCLHGLTLAHELGHSFGMQHDHAQPTLGTPGAPNLTLGSITVLVSLHQKQGNVLVQQQCSLRHMASKMWDTSHAGNVIKPYSYGYRMEGMFSTIMAYPCQISGASFCSRCAPCAGIPYFSNPRIKIDG